MIRGSSLEIKRLLEQAAKRAQFDDETKEKILRWEIIQVYLSEKKRSLLLCAQHQDLMNYQDMLRISHQIEQILLLNRVRILPFFMLDSWNESSAVLLAQVLREEMGEKDLVIKGSIASIIRVDRTLKMGVHSKLAIKHWEQKGKRKILDQILATMLPWMDRMEFFVVEDTSFKEKMIDLEKERLICFHETNQSTDDYACEVSLTERVILGHDFATIPLNLESIQEEEKSAAIYGKVINLEIRELRSGRILITFDVISKKCGLSVKYFQPENGQRTVLLENGQFIKARGSIQQDRYSQELTMQVKDIVLVEEAKRKDSYDKKRIELHLHTTMSALDGLTDIKEALNRAKEWGHSALAITDHGGAQAFPAAFQWTKKDGSNVKVIYGMEAYFVDDSYEEGLTKKPYHMIILVKSTKGFQNLYQLITSSNLRHFYRKPRVMKSELDSLREGLIIGSACEAGELYQSILHHKSDEEIENIAKYYDYLEVQPIGNNAFLIREGWIENEEVLKELNRRIVLLGKKLGIPVVATGDVHFLDPDDEIYRKIIQTGQGYKDTTQPPLFYRTTEEMLAEFSYLNKELAYEIVVENTHHIANLIDDNLVPIQTKLHTPKMDGADVEIKDTCVTRAKELYGDPLPSIVENRLNRELESIINNGFAVLYLIAEKLVKKSNEDGYLVGSRGSVGSSFVATLLGITEVNPLAPHYICSTCYYNEFILDGSIGSGADLPQKDCPNCGMPMIKDGHEIPFETFLGFDGDKIPDIDLNFSGDYQSTIHKYTEVLFGKDHVFKAGTIATIAEKTAYGFSKKYLEEQGEHAYRSAQLAALAHGCTGVKRTTGQHPGGIIVLPRGENVNCFTPLQRPAEDTESDIVTSHFDYHSIDSSLVKLDLLGHDDPTVIKMLEDLTHTNAKSISLDDEKTLSLFRSSEALHLDPKILDMDIGSLGIPEFGTKFVRQMLQDTRPIAFSELVRISGFSHGTDVWLNNAQELIFAKIAKLSEAISTRDDIMSYLLHKNLPPLIAFRIMEDVRKGKGLKEEYEEEMRKFHVPDWYIDSCKKIKYMFPKAHAVAYVTMAFRIAWYKINHPEAFYATYFTVRADEFDLDIIRKGPENIQHELKKLRALSRQTARERSIETILEIALEMYARGIHLMPLNLYTSKAAEFTVCDGALLPPFNTIPGLGIKAAKNIVVMREEKPIISVEDLRIRARLSNTVIELMRDLGMLTDLPESEQMSLFA